MAKRKTQIDTSSDDENDGTRGAPSSPDKPLQTARRTGKKPRKTSGNESGSDDDLVPKAPKRTKAKETKVVGIKKPASVKGIKKPRLPLHDEEEEEDAEASNIKIGMTPTGDRYVDLGKKRRATVNTFKGGKYLDIREFYGDDNDLKPGKKGISITQEQWETLKKSGDVIDSFFAKLK